MLRAKGELWLAGPCWTISNKSLSYNFRKKGKFLKFEMYRRGKKPVLVAILFLVIMSLLAACGDSTATPSTDTTPGPTTSAITPTPFASGIPQLTGKTVATADGLQYIDTKVGDGA